MGPRRGYGREFMMRKAERLIIDQISVEECLPGYVENTGYCFLGKENDRKSALLQRAHFSLTHTTPLLPATTPSEGECRVSAG
jgi:hypothetical protein